MRAAIRRSDGVDVKHGTYRRRSTVCYPAPIRTDAEGEGEDRFGADRGSIVEPAMAGSRPGAAGPLPWAAGRARVSVSGIPARARAAGLWRGAVGALPGTRAS